MHPTQRRHWNAARISVALHSNSSSCQQALLLSTCQSSNRGRKILYLTFLDVHVGDAKLFALPEQIIYGLLGGQRSGLSRRPTTHPGGDHGHTIGQFDAKG